MYTSDLSLYMNKDKEVLFNPKFGRHYISTLSSYRGYGVGFIPVDNGTYVNVDLEYGRLKSFSSSRKLTGSLVLANRYLSRSHIDCDLFVVLGFIQRLSSRYVLRVSGGLPLLSRDRYVSMLSFGIH